MSSDVAVGGHRLVYWPEKSIYGEEISYCCWFCALLFV